MRRIDRFEHELRRLAQHMSMESHRIEQVCNTTEDIKTQMELVVAGLGPNVLKPVHELQIAVKGQYHYLSDVLDKRMICIE